MLAYGPSRKRSPSDLPDPPWALVGPMLPPAKQRTRGGRPRQVDRRAVLHPMLSLNRSGGPWAMLPHAWRPQSTVSDDVVPWRDDGTWAGLVKAWRARHRVDAGREPPPRAACLESHAVKTTDMGGPARGDDGGKTMTGRKRHLLVATLGLLMTIVMTSAGVDDGMAALSVLGHVNPHDLPRLVTICADQKYHHHDFEAWMGEPRVGWRIDVKTRPAGTKGVTPLEKRWGIASTNAWPGRYRSNSKDDERSVASSTALIQIRNLHRMLNRLAPGGRPAFHYRKKAA
jgi:putative transposase